MKFKSKISWFPQIGEMWANKRIKTIRLIFIVMLISYFQLSAITSSAGISTREIQQQEKKITGKVTDKSGAPLPGVSIFVKGTTTGANADNNGNYSLVLPSDAKILSFSFIGMITQEITIGNQTVLNIILEEASLSLDEVVVIGYGTAQKKDLTGSVGVIDQVSVKNLPVLTIDQKMIGQLSGVQIQQVTGAPGGGTSVKIRGAGSLGAGNEPLYVVDGMPYAAGSDLKLNPLIFINPDDIESVSVLKDASSTAIYGSRGSNGVIMITTKKGQYDRTEINVSAMTGVQEIPQKGRPNMMNAQEFAEYQREIISVKLRAAEKREPTEDDFPVEYRNPEQLGEGTNWYDLLLRVAPVLDLNIGLMKGTKDSRINFSLGYYNQEGALKYSGAKRYSSRLYVDSKIGKALKIGGSLMPSFIVQNRAFTNTSREDVIGTSGIINPVMKAYDENGELLPFIYSPQNKYRSAASVVNPLFALRERKETQKQFNNIGIAFIEWEIIPNLIAKSSLNTILSSSDYFLYIPSTIGGYNSPPKPATGNSSSNRSTSFDWLTENTVTYNKEFDNHHFDALLGYSVEKSTSNGINLIASPYSNDLIQTINASQAISSWGQSINEWSMISYLSRINYAFKDRYLLTATFRSDGSSRFGSENRFGFFPSVAAAWNISDEEFLRNSKIIENLKLRISYGESGNNNISNYGHIGAVNAGSYVFGSTQVSALYVGLPNPYLTWEKSNEFDAGIDLALFNNRLSFVVDFYNRISQNMLINNIIPAITGFNNMTMNMGNVRNNGIEIAMDGTPLSGDFKWDINLNLSANRNKVISMNNNNDPIRSGNIWGLPTNITVVGKPIGQIYGLVWEGILTAEDMADPTVPKDNLAYEGSNKYKDIDGDGKITGLLDYDIVGNPYPDFIFGLTNRFSYKNFNLSMVMQGQYGGDIVDAMHGSTDNLSGAHNLNKGWVNRWHSAADPGDGIHCGVGLTEGWAWKNSSLWVEDASYLRISNLTLGYSLPGKWMTTTGVFKNCNLYFSVQNLAIFTNYHGANPEGQNVNIDNTLASGYDYTSYPLSRVFSIGVNLSF